MSYSYYEVYTNTQRAFAGIGFPYGADEDAAYIITWLELYNLKGIDLFCEFVEKFYHQYDYKIDVSNNEKKIDLKNKSNLPSFFSLFRPLISTYEIIESALFLFSRIPGAAIASINFSAFTEAAIDAATVSAFIFNNVPFSSADKGLTTGTKPFSNCLYRILESTLLISPTKP